MVDQKTHDAFSDVLIAYLVREGFLLKEGDLYYATDRTRSFRFWDRLPGTRGLTREVKEFLEDCIIALADNEKLEGYAEQGGWDAATLAENIRSQRATRIAQREALAMRTQRRQP